MLKFKVVMILAGLWCGLASQVVSQDSDGTVAPESAESSQPKVSKEKPISFWMQQKLELSKSILESLTRADFERLTAEATKLRRFSKLEGFVRRKNPEYRAQMRMFELANQQLSRQAERENVEGAAIAFNQLTASCVSCHVLIREAATLSP